jgi:hypothetical protein
MTGHAGPRDTGGSPPETAGKLHTEPWREPGQPAPQPSRLLARQSHRVPQVDAAYLTHVGARWVTGRLPWLQAAGRVLRRLVAFTPWPPRGRRAGRRQAGKCRPAIAPRVRRPGNGFGPSRHPALAGIPLPVPPGGSHIRAGPPPFHTDAADQARATSTPGTTWPAIRATARLNPETWLLPGSDATLNPTTTPQR